MARRHLVIHGRVQGVGFRYSAERQASVLGLAGWVRNREDGAVEVDIQGADEGVEHFLAWAHRGPPTARVDRVEAVTVQDDPSRTGFRVTG